MPLNRRERETLEKERTKTEKEISKEIEKKLKSKAADAERRLQSACFGKKIETTGGMNSALKG
jgi:hypothetical protein